MKQMIDLSFAERRKAAGEARKRLLEKLTPALKLDTPEAIEKRAERAAAAAARDSRRAERAAAESRAAADASAAALAREAEADRLSRLEIDGKAQRDQRYSARKARQA